MGGAPKRTKVDINDTLREYGADAARNHHDRAQKFDGDGDGDGKANSPPILTKRQFVSGFTPPDYLVDGVLQKRFIYALTGATSHGKTAIALYLAELVSSRDPHAALGNHGVEKGRVIYLVGENPDELCMRVIGADSLRHDKPETDQIAFVPGTFHIPDMRAALERHARKMGGVDFVVVDTSAAFFLGDEELSNTQMGQHARMLRSLTTLPGRPCVLVLCHPIKHVTEPSQLLPRGGGAFVAEVDGNLTAWKRDDVLVELHHNKIRGPGFGPITFRLERITAPALVDAKGRSIPTVRAVPISEHEEEATASHVRDGEDHLLVAMSCGPDRSVANLARACGWTVGNGDPAKSKVHRLLAGLEGTKPKLVTKERNHYRLTEAGKSAADSAAAKFNVARRHQD
jgi:AAA domain